MSKCTILNLTGDVTISWDDNNNEDVKKWIESKLEEGCTFFIVEKKLGFIPMKKKVSNVSSLPNNGEVKISDEDAKQFFVPQKPKMAKKLPSNSGNTLKLGDFGAEQLVNKGAAKPLPKEESVSHKVKKVAKTAQEIMTNDTMCARRMVGG